MPPHVMRRLHGIRTRWGRTLLDSWVVEEWVSIIRYEEGQSQGVAVYIKYDWMATSAQHGIVMLEVY